MSVAQCGAGRPPCSPRASHLVVLQHLGSSLLVRDGQPDVGEGGGIVAQPQAHLHFHRLTDRPCHRVRCFTFYSSSHTQVPRADVSHGAAASTSPGPGGSGGLSGALGVALTEGWVGDPSAVQLVRAIGAVVPAITHRLQCPALAISTGELCGAAGLCKMRGDSAAGHGLGHGHRQRAGLPAGSQPVPILTTPVSALLGHWPGDIQVSGCRALPSGSHS